MLKEKLKLALKAAGLSEELAETINITSEAQIEGIVIGLQSTQSNDGEIDFNTVLGSPKFTEFVTKTGFDNVLKLSKSLQSEHDKKVTAGIKTFQEKYFKKINGEDNDDDDPTKMKNENNDTPAWAKALMDDVKELKNSKTKSTKLEQATTVINASKVLPDTLKKEWINRFNLESETSFDEQLKGLETEYTNIHKTILGDVKIPGLPQGGNPPTGEASDEEIAAIADNLI